MLGRIILLATLALGWPSVAIAVAELSATESTSARNAAVGDSIVFAHLPLGTERDGSVRMKRIDVYAPDARILVPDGKGYQEVPRSSWLQFVADRSVADAPRLGLSIAPDGRSATGVLFAADGRTLEIKGVRFGGGLRFELADARRDDHGAPTQFSCGNDRPDWKSLQVLAKGSGPALNGDKTTTVASRSAVVAVDTDNELLLQKFADNTTTATNYLAALFTGMNVIYERDLDLSLLQGTTILRTSGTADPFTTNGSDIFAQLTEFGTHWANTQGGVTRAFSMQLSGKSNNANSSAGIAWVLGSVNYCTSRNSNGGHYSVSQVFKFAGSNASHDLLVVAHELGHNFGAEHTHCSNSTTGAGTVSSNTIDQCYSGEAGCFSGVQICPAATTVNGVANVKGTLMSYCHLSGIAGCTSSEVFATAHRTLLTPRVSNNVTLGCFTGTATNAIFANGFE